MENILECDDWDWEIEWAINLYVYVCGVAGEHKVLGGSEIWREGCCCRDRVTNVVLCNVYVLSSEDSGWRGNGCVWIPLVFSKYYLRCGNVKQGLYRVESKEYRVQRKGCNPNKPFCCCI